MITDNFSSTLPPSSQLCLDKTRWFRALSVVFSMFVMMCMLSGCTPSQQTALPTINTTKNTPILWLQSLQTSDGTRLPLRRWWPSASANPKAIVIALHGFNDYNQAFDLPAHHLNAKGIAVLAYDQRGFGTSPARGIWANNDNLTHDLVDMVHATAHAYPNTPLYLLGESMGGAVAITTLTKYPLPELRGVILSAPALWGSNTLNPLYRLTLWTAAHTIPYYTLTGKQAKILASDNIPMLIAMGKDPHIIKETRIDTIYGLVSLMDQAHAQAPLLTHTPTLLLYGQHDQVIPAHAITEIGSKLEHNNATIAYYPRGYHMLLRDLHADIVLDDIISWINAPCNPLPSKQNVEWQTRIQNHKGRR